MSGQQSLPGVGDCNHVVCVHHRKTYKLKGCGLVAAVERAEQRLEAARAALAAATPEQDR